MFSMGCQRLDQELVMGCCFGYFLLWNKEDNVEGQMVHLRLRVEDKCWMMRKLSILVFLCRIVVKNFGEECLKI